MNSRGILVFTYLLAVSLVGVHAFTFGGRNPFAISHRGYCSDYPENTLLAFEMAIEMGTDGIETDLHYTKDGYIVLLHDDTLDRTTNCTGNVAEWTLSDLQTKCDASYKGKFGDKFANDHVRVPLFEDLLKIISGTDVFIVMDLKAGLLFAEKVLPMIQKYSVQDHVIASCRTVEQMEDFMHNASVVPRQYLVTNYNPWDPNADPQFYFPWTEKSIMGFSVKYEYIDAEFVKKTHARLMSVFSWVTDAPADVPGQIKMGIDAIMTDNTPMLVEQIKSYIHAEESSGSDDDCSDKYSKKTLIWSTIGSFVGGLVIAGIVGCVLGKKKFKGESYHSV